MICSRAHGRDNIPFMTKEVFRALMQQLHDVEFSEVQTSGCGDPFLHPHFLGWLKQFRREFPHAKINNFSSFALLTPSVAEVMLGERLVDDQWTRIDSLNEDIQSRSTCVNAKVIFTNIDHWIARNKDTRLHINYSSVYQYHRKCQVLLGKRPMYSPFTDKEVGLIPDEFEAIQKRFAGPNVTFARINHSLWAEREDPRTIPDPDSECPKLASGILQRVIWISPDGSVTACGYDDAQREFVYGNILDRPIAELWHSKEREQQLLRIARRDVRGYPCFPRCCRLYGDHEV